MVIFTVLLASVTLPALAANELIYDPADYFYYQAISGDTKTLWFQVQTTPYVKFYIGHDLQYYGWRNQEWLDTGSYGATNRYEVFPLGLEAMVGSGMVAGFDVRSFNDGATISLMSNFSVRLTYSYSQYAAGDGTVQYTASYSLLMYDEDFNFIGIQSPTAETGSITLPEKDPNNTWSVTHQPFSSASSVRLSDGCAYIAPLLKFQFIQPDEVDGAYVHTVAFLYNWWNLGISRSLVAEQSLLMQSIDDKLAETNDQLGDLNDKADTIINGTDEQQEDFENFQNQQQDVDEDLQDAMSKLEGYQNFDTSTVFGAINDFLEADGWHEIRFLLQPLLDWEHTATIMIFVLAFATLRTLLLGR